MAGGKQVHTASEDRDTNPLSDNIRRVSLVHRLRIRFSTVDVFNQVKRVITYNLPHTVLNVVRSNVMARRSGANDNHFLPSIILRVRKLGCVDNLSPEVFLIHREGMSSELSPMSSSLTHLSFKVWDVRFYGQPARNDDVGGVKDSHCSVGSTAANCDVPLSLVILAHLLYKSGSPDIQLQRFGIELQPLGKLTDGISRNGYSGNEETHLWRWYVNWPT